MGNVIDKTFSILERIAVSSPDPMLPTQLADELNLNRATCSRLLKQLLDMGYILKVSRQQGYVPGPKLLTMNNLVQFQQGFLNHAVPVIDRCAEELQTSVLTAQVYHGKRYVLYHKNLNSYLDIQIKQPCFDDLFETATGVVLMSHSKRKEQISIYQAAKEKKRNFFSGFSTEEEMLVSLDQTKRNGFFVFENSCQWICACPVLRAEKCIAALGASMPAEQCTADGCRNIVKTIRNAAQEISRKLKPDYIIG